MRDIVSVKANLHGTCWGFPSRALCRDVEILSSVAVAFFLPGTGKSGASFERPSVVQGTCPLWMKHILWLSPANNHLFHS